MISDILNGEAYFLVKGEPMATIRFPWREVVLMAVMMIIIIRLMFRKKE